ncbi:MAG: hypothetical protein ACQEQF_00030 [Bacillota bacterium]
MNREEKIKLMSADEGRIIHVRRMNFKDFFDDWELKIPNYRTEVEIELTQTGILIGWHDNKFKFVRDFIEYKEMADEQIDFVIGELKLQGVI